MKKEKECVDITGNKYGMLTVISHHKGREWLCECSCENKTRKTIRISWLESGEIKSCGCRLIKHGMYLVPGYDTWKGMVRRCHNEKSKEYKNYGGRGITVCERWRYSPKFFIEDMGQKPGPEYSLNRIDNDKGYYRENCEWTTALTQQRNRRSCIYITIDSITKTVKEWCTEYNLKYTTILYRIHNGWEPIRALTTPIRPKKKNSTDDE